MNEFSNLIFLYLALACLAVSLFFWLRSRKRRKRELENRRSLGQRLRDKIKKEKKPVV